MVAGMSRFLTIRANWRARRPDFLWSLLRGGCATGLSIKESYGVSFGSGDAHQALGSSLGV